MSSGFVSGGTADQPTERDEEWLRAQQEIEANRRAKEELSRQNEGKSLYEVLQANKAAKQEAFEESIRLKNQFRSLDEDEVDFLDAVLESTRAKEEAVRKETVEKLEIFRQQQVAADQAIMTGETEPTTAEIPKVGNSSPSDEAQWSLYGKKRKRTKEREILKGVKLRKSASSNHDGDNAESPRLEQKVSNDKETLPLKAPEFDQNTLHLQEQGKQALAPFAESTRGKPAGLDLGAYDSDDE